MKKIPTLFKRVFSPDHKTKTILPEVTPGCEAVLEGRCIPTVKWDGACCAIIGGEIYKRYDAKIGKGGKQKQPPKGAIPCQPEPDPITGHWPHWVKCEEGKPEDKYFLEAFENCKAEAHNDSECEDCTCEACGPHFQGNPYGLDKDRLLVHGRISIPWERIKDCNGDITFDSIRTFLEIYQFGFDSGVIEGIVFWKDNEPLCKIKRSDFGFPWPPRKGE